MPTATPTALGPYRMHSKFRQMWSVALREYFEELFTTETDVLRELAHFGRFLAQRGESENLFELCHWRGERFTRLMADAHAWDGHSEITASAGRQLRRATADLSPLRPALPLVQHDPTPFDYEQHRPRAEAVLAELKRMCA